MTLGQKLRFFRTAEGYSQKEIADMLSIERSTYTYYETGKTLPTLHAVWTLAKLYRVTMEFLVDDRLMPVGTKEFVLLGSKKRGRRKKKHIS